ncbi:MAG TPA: CPBP family intramembrane glutamic endopeptidase [Thermoanaerobaculia bacterium]
MYDDQEPTPPPEPPLALLSPPRAPRRGWEIGVWAVLVTLAVAIFVLTLLAPPPEDAGGTAGGLELQLQGRYAVGVDALFEPLGGGLARSMTGQLLEQLRAEATTIDERLCLVPVVAELDGPEEALEDIESLRAEDGLEPAAAADLEVLRTIYADSPAAVDEEARQAFFERRDWFARLALSHGPLGGDRGGEHGSDDDPERRALLADARRIAVLLLVVVAAVIMGGAAGLALLAVGFVLRRQGRLRPAYAPRRDAGGTARRVPMLETVVVFILATIAASVVAGLVLEVLDNDAWALGATLLALPSVLWPLLRGVSAAEMRQAFGWHAGTGVWREVGWGLVGYVAGAPLLIAGILVSVVLTRWVEQPPHHPIMDTVAGAGWAEILLIYVVACVSAPLAEETVFRGGFYHYLRGALGAAASAFVVSAFFALIHPQGILGIPPLIALAMILALIREWRGSLVASVAVHAVHNALATTVILVLLG